MKVVVSAEAGAKEAKEAEVEVVMAVILEATAALDTSDVAAAARPAVWVISVFPPTSVLSARPATLVSTGTPELIVSVCPLLPVLLKGPAVLSVGQAALVASVVAVGCPLQTQ